MAAVPPAPAPPAPPPVPEIPHLILGSLRYTLAWDVAASAFLLLVWFFGGRLESYWLSFATGDGVAATRRRPDDSDVAPRRDLSRCRNARLRQLLAVWRTSKEEVTSLCGADARDYLVVQRLLFMTLAAAAVPGACALLPVALAMSARDASSSGAFDDASLFARTTVHHFPTKSPVLWLVAFVSVCAVCAVETASDAIDGHRARTSAACAETAREDETETRAASPEALRRARSESSESSRSAALRVETTTLLLRRLPRAVTLNPDALRRALDETFGNRTYAVVVPRDGAEASARRAIGIARRKLAAARSGRSGRSDRENAVALRGLIERTLDAEDDLRRLSELRRAKGAYVPNPGCAFVIFKDARAARHARHALQPTARGVFLALVAPIVPDRLIRRLALRGTRDDAASSPRATPSSPSSPPRDVFPPRATFFDRSSGASSSPPEPRAIALGVRRGVHFWRCDPAPPPAGVLWENVGVAPGRRFLLTLLVNATVSLGLVFASSPLALFSYAGELAANLDPKADWRWDAWLSWARVEGGAYGGLVFQFAPNAAALVMIYFLIPRALESATRVEQHLTRSGALRSLVNKEFAYFLVNLLLLLALGKAALSAVVEQVRECQWHATPDACETKFVAVLGESFVAEAAMSLCGFLCTCCTLGPAWELLSAFAWIREAAADARETNGRSDEDARLGTRGAPSVVDADASDAADAFADATPPPRANGGGSREAETLRPSPFARLALRRRSPRRPSFDLPGQHAFNATVLACAVAFAALAPVLLVPGALFFAARYLVHKHNLLCLHLDAVAGAGEGGASSPASDDARETASFDRVAPAAASDGRLLATVARVVRVSALIHATVMAAFLHLRGTDAQAAVAAALLVATAARRRVAPPLRAAAGRWFARFVSRRRVAEIGGGAALGAEDDDGVGSSLRRSLLGDAEEARAASGETLAPAPPETLREAKKTYRGPSGDADEAAHELTASGRSGSW